MKRLWDLEKVLSPTLSARETRNLTLIIQFRFNIFRFISLIELLDVRLFRCALTRSDIYFNSNGSLRLNEMKFDDLLSVSSLRSSCSLISSIDFFGQALHASAIVSCEENCGMSTITSQVTSRGEYSLVTCLTHASAWWNDRMSASIHASYLSPAE